MRRGPRAARRWSLLVAAALLLACGADAGTVQWRGAAIEVPEGWTVFEEEDTRLSMANAPLGDQAIDAPDDLPDGDVVAMFFTHEPGTIPDDWREFVAGREDAEIESDVAIEIDEVPATRIIFHHASADAPTREMVVIVPAREVVVLAQPVPAPGDTDASEVFDRHLETFLEVVEAMRWGAPVE